MPRIEYAAERVAVIQVGHAEAPRIVALWETLEAARLADKWEPTDTTRAAYDEALAAYNGCWCDVARRLVETTQAIRASEAVAMYADDPANSDPLAA